MNIYKFNTVAEYNAAKSTLGKCIVYIKEIDKTFFLDGTSQGGGSGENVPTIEVKIIEKTMKIRHSELAEDDQIVMLYKGNGRIKLKGEDGDGHPWHRVKIKKWSWRKHLVFSKGTANEWYVPEVVGKYDQKHNTITEENVTEMGLKMIAAGKLSKGDAPSELSQIAGYEVAYDDEEGSWKADGFGGLYYNDYKRCAMGIIKAGGTNSLDRNKVLAKAIFRINLTAAHDVTSEAMSVK